MKTNWHVFYAPKLVSRSVDVPRFVTERWIVMHAAFQAYIVMKFVIFIFMLHNILPKITQKRDGYIVMRAAMQAYKVMTFVNGVSPHLQGIYTLLLLLCPVVWVEKATSHSKKGNSNVSFL
jgi:hypothetical protein